MFALVARRRKVQQARRGSLSAQLRDTLRYTSFLGAFAGIYVSVEEGIAALFGNRRRATILISSWLRQFYITFLLKPTSLW